MIPVRNCHKTIKYTRDEVVRFDQNSYLQAVRDTPIARVTGCVFIKKQVGDSTLPLERRMLVYTRVNGSTG